MKQHCSLLALAVTLAIAAPAQAQLLPQAHSTGLTQDAQGNQVIDRIVAVVDDGIILQSELDSAVHSIQQQYASHPEQLPPLDVLQRQVLQRLILMRLQENKASDQGIQVSDAEVNRAVAGVAQQNKLSVDQLRAAVEQSGTSFASFRKQLADQLLIQKLHQSVIHDQVQVTDSEINNLLSSPTYKAGEIHLAHIQISIPAGASAADIAKAKAKATAAIEAIKGGMDFNAAAIRFSDAQDALSGGDLGWRRMDEVPPAFVSTISAMKPGDVSPALRGPTGFHILKLEGVRQPPKQIVTEVHARQILIKPSELVSAQQAQQKADDIYKRLTSKHEDFAALAKQDSNDDTTANLGGDMGWMAPQAWGPEIAQHLEALKDGEISHPFQTQQGWVILQREGSRQSDHTTDIERNEARQAIGNRKAEQAYEDFLRQLRADAYIKILVPSLRDPDQKADDDAS